MENQKKKKHPLFLSSTLVSLLLLLPFLTPESIQYLSPVADYIFDCWLFLAAFIILILYIIRGKTSPVIVVITVYELVVLFSTVINSGAVLINIKNLVLTIGLCMLIDLQLNTRPGRFLKILFFVLSGMVIINLLTVILYPNGLYKSEFYIRNWFLGYKNVHTLYIYPLLAVFEVYSIKRQWSLAVKAGCVALFVFSVYLIGDSGSAIASITLWIVLWLACEGFKFTKFLSVYRVLLAHFVFFICIVVFRLQNYLSFVIENWLGKSLTFTGRTSRWDIAFKLIAEKPVLGWGQQSGEVMRTELLDGLSHCHNEFLQILFQSGIIGLFIFLIAFYLLHQRMAHVQNRKLVFLFCCILLCFFLIFQVEAVNMTMFWGFLVIFYNAPVIETVPLAGRRHFTFGKTSTVMNQR